MAFRRSFASISALTVVVASMSLVAMAQDKGKPPQPPKLSRDEQRRAEAMYQLVDNVNAGKVPAPADVMLTWSNHFLLGSEGRTYVPYTLDIEPGKFTSFPVIMYVRLADRNAPPPAKDAKEPPTFAWFDGYFFNEPKDGRISRLLEARPGDYDLYIAMQENTSRNVKQPRTVLLKRALRVPDFAKELSASDVIFTENIEPNSKQLSPTEQLAEPYTLGGMKLTPARTAEFKKSGVLAFLVIVYNSGANADKPDVVAEYNFYQKLAGGEKFFNRTSPQTINAQTLPPGFSVAAGHQVVASPGDIPLGSFPEGAYRLEIKVTDKTNNKVITQNAEFAVTAG
jgi:hypothetical protein